MIASPASFSTANFTLPPQNVEAEEWLLGGILLDPSAIERVVDKLPPEAFYISHHQIIYKAAIALHRRGLPTDLMHVATWLYDHKELEKIGGQSKLANLVDRTVSSINLDRYADLILDKYLRRCIIHTASEVVQLGYETFLELPTLVDRIGAKFESLHHPLMNRQCDPDEFAYNKLIKDIRELEVKISDPGLKTWKLQKLAKQYDRSPKQLEELYFKSLIANENEPLMTWKELHDRYGDSEREWLLHGFLPKGVVVALHAAGGTGKTRLAYDMLYSLAQGAAWNGFPATGKRRTIVIQTDEAPIDMLDVLKRRGFTDELATSVRYKTKWTVDHIQQLRAEIEQFKPELVIIDSLTSVSRNSIFSENEVEYARPVLLLKDIAQEYNCTVLLVHHSSKEGKMRGTSAIFNSVSEVWRMGTDTSSTDPLDRLLIIEKSRSRRPTSYRLKFEPEDSSWFYQGEAGVDENNPDLSTKEAIVKFLSDHRGIKYEATEIHEIVGGAYDHCRRCCYQLAQDGVISSQRLRRQGNPYIYFIAGADGDDQNNSPSPQGMISIPIRNENLETSTLTALSEGYSMDVTIQDDQKNSPIPQNLIDTQIRNKTLDVSAFEILPDQLITQNDIFLEANEGKKIGTIDDQLISNLPKAAAVSVLTPDQGGEQVAELSDHLHNQRQDDHKEVAPATASLPPIGWWMRRGNDLAQVIKHCPTGAFLKGEELYGVYSDAVPLTQEEMLKLGLSWMHQTVHDQQSVLQPARPAPYNAKTNPPRKGDRIRSGKGKAGEITEVRATNPKYTVRWEKTGVKSDYDFTDLQILDIRRED